MLAHGLGGVATHRAEHHVCVEARLHLEQGREPARGSFLVVVEEGDQRRAGCDEGAVSGAGDSGGGLAGVDHREGGLGRQPLYSGTGALRGIVVDDHQLDRVQSHLGLGEHRAHGALQGGRAPAGGDHHRDAGAARHQPWSCSGSPRGSRLAERRP